MMGILNVRKVGGEYFILKKFTKSDKDLEFYLKFNLNDYIILKLTSKQRLVSEEEFLIFKHAGYMFFRKDIYNIKHIEKWLKWINSDTLTDLKYLSKPFPPIELLDKIKIIDSL